MNKTLAKKLFIVGANRRNPGLFDRTDFLMKSQFWSKDRLKDYQMKRLKELLEFARKNTALYKDIELGNDPSAALASIPVITKTELIDRQAEISAHPLFEKKILSETSGSSGQALKFYRNLEWDTFNRASLFRFYSWYNVEPWEKNGYFWGYNFDASAKWKTRLFDLLQNRFRLFSYEEEDVHEFLQKLRSAAYLHGYSSMIYELAQMVVEKGYSPQDFPGIKMIKGTSEKIYDHYQKAVQTAFGKKIVSEYGAAESGVIAFECPMGFMHINEENVVVEEEDGEVIVTNLNSYSFPIIRYKLGDAVKLGSSEMCSCGRKSDLVLEVLGRVGKNILGYKSKYPSLTLYYIFKNLALEKNIELQYQGYQTEKGKLTLRIQTKTDEQTRSLILTESQKYFKGDMEVKVEDEYTIHTKDKKLKDFITELQEC